MFWLRIEDVHVYVCAGQSKTGSIVKTFETLLSFMRVSVSICTQCLYLYLHEFLHALYMGQWRKCKSMSLLRLPCELGLAGFGETHLTWQRLAFQRLPEKSIWQSCLENTTKAFHLQIGA